jgi:hypothetical protein
MHTRHIYMYSMPTVLCVAADTSTVELQTYAHTPEGDATRLTATTS